MDYTYCYCEENIYKLAQKEPSITHAVFITNASKSVPFFNSILKDLVIWDYHVIALDVVNSLIYDLDSRVDYPTSATNYFQTVLQIDRELSPQFERMYRCVPTKDFLDVFSSDRSHMKNLDGTFKSTPPKYPCIQNGDIPFNLDRYIDVKEMDPIYGRLFSQSEFERFVFQR